ncbi:response regulator transcription factor [Paraburkholderia sp. C35]|uniref:response regulator transcription factor n=1 Tax=Paraburkholderia sp. C35 TaxID=2126993 RepID=UPI000D6880F2|nr:response regulator transcription factor [Paraburkholderia sp. C35]
MRVLLVEDDVQVGQSLFRALKDAHYTVDWIRDGKAAAIAIDSTCYAAVLLDLGLPDVGGIDLLKSLRGAGNPVPVVILTECDDLDVRVRSLDVGADDCVLKPVDMRELLARLRAVLRRRAGYATSRIGDEALSLDLEKRTLHRHGVASTLSAREFALMHSFLERPGTILSRSQLEDRIYGWGKEIGSNAVDVLIHSMRKRFGPTLIRNVRGLGWTVTRSREAGAA